MSLQRYRLTILPPPTQPSVLDRSCTVEEYEPCLDNRKDTMLSTKDTWLNVGQGRSRRMVAPPDLDRYGPVVSSHHRVIIEI